MPFEPIGEPPARVRCQWGIAVCNRRPEDPCGRKTSPTKILHVLNRGQRHSFPANVPVNSRETATEARFQQGVCRRGRGEVQMCGQLTHLGFVGDGHQHPVVINPSATIEPPAPDNDSITARHDFVKCLFVISDGALIQEPFLTAVPLARQYGSPGGHQQKCQA